MGSSDNRKNCNAVPFSMKASIMQKSKCKFKMSCSHPKVHFCWIQAVEGSFHSGAHAHEHDYWAICLRKSTTGATSHLKETSILLVFMCLLDTELHGEQKCFLDYLVLLHCYTFKVLVYQGTRMFIPIRVCVCIHVLLHPSCKRLVGWCFYFNMKLLFGLSQSTNKTTINI